MKLGVSDVATNESAINFKWEKQGERTKPKTSALTPLKEQRCERHVHKCQWTSALKHPELKPDRHSRVQMTRQYYSDEPAQPWVMFLSLRLSPLPCRSPFSFAVQWSEDIPPLKVDPFLGGCQDLRSLVFWSCPEQNCATFSWDGAGDSPPLLTLLHIQLSLLGTLGRPHPRHTSSSVSDCVLLFHLTHGSSLPHPFLIPLW